MVFPGVMYGSESWTIKKAEHWRTNAFESWRRLLIPLDCKEIKLVNPKGNCPENIHWKDWCWSWNSKLWPPDMKSQLIRKDPGAGKDWRQEEKGTAEDEMVGWHHWFNGHELEQALGDGEGEGNLVCCSPWGCKESDMTEQLNNNISQMNKPRLWEIKCLV